MFRKITLDTIVTLISILFSYTALSKFSEYNIFKTQLAKSPFINDWSTLISVLVPLGEIITVLLLISNKTRLLGLYTSLFFMTMFTAYIFMMLKFSYYLPCSCGGVLSMLSWDGHFWFNLSFTILCALGIFLDKYKPKYSERISVAHKSHNKLNTKHSPAYPFVEG